MTFELAVATIFGGFLFPFAIIMLWGRMVETWGAIGGWMAAAFIVGTVWTINHGLSSSLIHQSGDAWIDMAWAAGIGIFVSSAISGGKISKSLTNLSSAVVGGIAGGFLLSLFL
ncbi:Lin0368 family putative glycerol transporter subunit [Peribacillus sp. SCS-155]|uniref:Lin0368 family putative glycerol transporter subunit n=1 Tax=Peribacillus sedimenti TaxID=3115297 RepID=UPI003905E6CD